MSKKGERTMAFERGPRVMAGASTVGPREGEGPLGSVFDRVEADDRLGRDTYEQSEAEMMTRTAYLAIKKAGLSSRDIDVMIAGDLEQQILASTISARTLGTGFLGVYGACSTIAEAMLVGAALIDAGHIAKALCITSSHFSTAEREFRYPQELGNQRTPSAQRTVTGSGAVILSSCADDAGNAGAVLEAGTYGRVVDYDIKDVNNMGAAMAPAAADTICTHFCDMGRTPDDYDMIVTGDLGCIGRELLMDIMDGRGMALKSEKLMDCGARMFSPEQDMCAGGSGCACLACVFASLLLGKLRRGEIKRLLIVGTGALLSPLSALQGESIPAIAHALALRCP